MQTRKSDRLLQALIKVTCQAESLAAQVLDVASATEPGARPSFEARSDAVQAVARLLERVGRVIAALVGLQLAAADLAVCLQAVAAGRAFADLSRALFGLRDGSAAGTFGADLRNAVENLLAEAQQGIAALHPVSGAHAA
jgi:hypothetical protein